MPARFFPTSPSSLGNILVPNSSPISLSDPISTPYKPYGYLRTNGGASSSNSISTNGWGQSKPSLPFDPLSEPSGFVSNTGISNASLRRQWTADEGFGHEEGPPRKKINRGTSRDALVVPDSPPSPDIQRVGQRRPIQPIGLDDVSMSSEESVVLQDRTLAGSSKSRLTKTRPSPSLDSSLSEAPTDREFISFRMTYPTESLARIQAAWNQAGGDVKRATAFLADSTWSPTRPSTAAIEKETLGRVREIEEASKAHRAAVKEKGKRSLIYANRPILETKLPTTPLSTRPVVDLTTPSSAAPASPLTPAINVPQRKRAKRLVIHSDDESDFVDSADDDRDAQRGHLDEATYEMRALEYLNCSALEALQELTGECYVSDQNP